MLRGEEAACGWERKEGDRREVDGHGRSGVEKKKEEDQGAPLQHWMWEEEGWEENLIA